MKHQVLHFLLFHFLFILGCSTSQTNLFNETIPKGEVAQGQCVEGDCVNGQGTYKIDANNQYTGTFKNGKAHGQGRFEMMDAH